MTEIGIRFSINDAPVQLVTKTTVLRRRRNPQISTSANLFNHRQRNHQMQYSAVLPINSLTPFSDFKEPLNPMATSKKSTKQTPISVPMHTEYRLKMLSSDAPPVKPRITHSNRSVISNMPKSSLSYPTTIPNLMATPLRTHYYQLPTEQNFNNIKMPSKIRRIASARITSNAMNNNYNNNNNNNLNQNSYNMASIQQQSTLLTSPLLPRTHPQYGHFLAYLRRQSLARKRRKQEQEAANSEYIETVMRFHATKSLSSQPFQSPSNTSLSTAIPELGSTVTTSGTPRRRPRPLSSHPPPRRPSSSVSTNYRLNLSETPPLKLASVTQIHTNDSDLHLVAPATSLAATPRNSIVEDTTKLSSMQTPYELQLSGDMLNYCYVSDSGVKYQGQLLSTPV